MPCLYNFEDEIEVIFAPLYGVKVRSKFDQLIERAGIMFEEIPSHDKNCM